MDNIKFENFLGQNIYNIIINDIKPKRNIALKNTFSILFKNPLEHYNNHIYHVSFVTSENQEVNRVHIDLMSLIDKQFYSQLVNIYGEPNTILVKDNILYQSKKSVNPKSLFHQNAQKTTYNTKEGTFEEEPVYLLWKKNHFQLEVLMKYSRNTSEVIFTKTN